MPQPELPAPRLVLATDMDGTLVGHPAYLRQLQEWLLERRGSMALVYLTGRTLESALDLIGSDGLLPPDVLVTDVGTRIFYGPRWREDRAWAVEMGLRWDGQAVEAALRGITGLAGQGVRPPLRRAYHLHRPVEEVLPAVSRSLERAGLAVTVVISSGKDLDVLPAGAGKGPALRYLRRKAGWPPGRILVAGDSGNDLSMIQLGFPAVVVGNARPELQGRRLPPRAWRASLPCAGGILEALERFFPDLTGPAVRAWRK